ncbi:hypothetical protein Tco_0586072 [Tanacetum coccineum]
MKEMTRRNSSKPRHQEVIASLAMQALLSIPLPSLLRISTRDFSLCNTNVTGGGSSVVLDLSGDRLPDPIKGVALVDYAQTLRGTGGESFWEEGDDFGVDVLHFYTYLTDILGFLEKFGWWFKQDIDDEREEVEEDEEDKDGGEV